MFQLWETESANLVGSYPSRDDALAIVRQATDAHGREVAATLLLLREDAGGRLTKIAEGTALVDLALEQQGTPVA